jgi:hypothetical protein
MRDSIFNLDSALKLLIDFHRKDVLEYTKYKIKPADNLISTIPFHLKNPLIY